MSATRIVAVPDDVAIDNTTLRPSVFIESGRRLHEAHLNGDERGYVAWAATNWRDWRDAGFPVLELSRHAAEELMLTKRHLSLEDTSHPFGNYFIALPTPGTLGGVTHIYVHSAGRVLSRVAPSGCIGPDSERELALNLVVNLATAMTHRSDDLVAERLDVRQLKSKPRPQITRIRMRTPVLHLTPHVQRFLIDGERAFHGRRGAHVMGFFRRAPGKEEKTVWVRPHFRKGALPAPEGIRPVRVEQ